MLRQSQRKDGATGVKIRNIPYGYQYQNGVIIVHPKETETVKEIFKEYLCGKSLLKIADRLNMEQIEYMPGVYGWNKSRIKRIIEDERYLGTNGYPPIIDEDMHNNLIRIKAEKNTQKNTDRKADIFNLGVPVTCPKCKDKMFRHHNPYRHPKVSWYCEKCRIVVNMDDGDLLKGITELLNTVIANPDIIQISDAQTEIKPYTDIMRLENEIQRELENIHLDKNTIIKKLLECVSLKYRDIDSQKYISKRLKADFANASPLIIFSMDLFNRTVKAIKFSDDGMVNIILINGQQIGKEQSDNANISNTTEISTCDSCTG